MTLLDRYLCAIRSCLPAHVPAYDIIAEICDALQSRIDEQQGALGRPLTDAELASLLKAYGHPRVIAARYGTVHYLIGPELLPFYWSTLQLVVTIVLAIELIAGAIAALVSHDGLIFFNALGAAWSSLLWIVGIVTVVFAIGERFPERGYGIAAFVGRWDPRSLPTPGVLPPAPRSSTLPEFVANTVALLVLLDARGTHRIPFDALLAQTQRELGVVLTPAWYGVYAGFTIGAALVAACALIVFLQPRLAMLRECAHVFGTAAVAAGAFTTLTKGPWVTPSSSALNTVALYTLVSILVVCVLHAAVCIRSLLRRPLPVEQIS